MAVPITTTMALMRMYCSLPNNHPLIIGPLTPSHEADWVDIGQFSLVTQDLNQEASRPS